MYLRVDIRQILLQHIELSLREMNAALGVHSNSLFEDNAEFGLGLRLAADRHTELARLRLSELRDAVGAELVDEILGAPQLRESELRAQRERIAELQRRLDGLDGPAVDDLRSVLDHLIRRSVWIVGGDGWAYDIGSGGLDHVLASGHNVNVLVLDTEVYSNTGGQMSKRSEEHTSELQSR